MVLTVPRNLAGDPLPMAFGDPQHLAQPTFSVAELLQAELGNRQKAIDTLRVQNKQRGASLNRLRLAAAALPVVFFVAAGLAALLRR